ncbi:MAG: response regulator [Desulfobacteraceae bacterium]|nr:response regulator [Desulfobacteraceae bacterium]
MPKQFKDPTDRNELRNRIVGLGKSSLRKSYYPQLQKQIKKLKLAKERAEENEKKFSLIFNSTSDGIILVDPGTGAIFLSNATAREMFGYQAEEMNRLTLDSLAGPGETDPVMARLILGNGTDRSTLRSISMEQKDKSAMVCDINASLVEIEGKTFILALIRDITELATMEKEKEEIKAQLAHSRKMEAMGTLAGGIAHDFNNILSGIFGYSQLAKSHISTPEKARQDIDQILKGAKKAADLIQQILTFSRKSSHHKQVLPIFKVVKDALKLLRSSLPATIEIREEIRSEALALADPTNIHQVVINLCTNAHHAMADTGGTVTVKLAETSIAGDQPAIAPLSPGAYLELTVSDTGHGMDPQTLDRIFEPYFTTKRTGRGTGLGLALVHSIVEDHQGHILVKSEPGQGTSFHVFLPVTDKAGTAPEKDREEESVPKGTERLLIVDDEASLASIAQTFFREQGYHVSTADNGVQALERFKSDPHGFDLVITDMTMPEMTGDLLATELLKIRPGLPIILCTGYSDKISKDRTRALGIRRYVEKPLKMNELGKTVRELLDRGET